jgi:hypothetical protein
MTDMKELRVLKEYRNRSLVYPVGSVIEVDEDTAARLIEAKPDMFEPLFANRTGSARGPRRGAISEAATAQQQPVEEIILPGPPEEEAPAPAGDQVTEEAATAEAGGEQASNDDANDDGPVG